MIRHGDFRYRVIHKKLSHKTEDKMQEKMKIILQVDENLAHIYQQYSESFCEKKKRFKSCIFTVDMAHFLSNIHAFDDYQIS